MSQYKCTSVIVKNYNLPGCQAKIAENLRQNITLYIGILFSLFFFQVSLLIFRTDLF